jgi:hypothetical protein
VERVDTPAVVSGSDSKPVQTATASAAIAPEIRATKATMASVVAQEEPMVVDDLSPPDIEIS